jgi:hypothetical protein
MRPPAGKGQKKEQQLERGGKSPEEKEKRHAAFSGNKSVLPQKKAEKIPAAAAVVNDHCQGGASGLW